MLEDFDMELPDPFELEPLEEINDGSCDYPEDDFEPSYFNWDENEAWFDQPEYPEDWG